MSKYLIQATRTYYSTIEFEVEADNYDEAEKKAADMIDNCVVEYDGIDSYNETDEIDVFLIKE